jgi:hypothetical protein
MAIMKISRDRLLLNPKTGARKISSSGTAYPIIIQIICLFIFPAFY